jgi:hypothetical protein
MRRCARHLVPAEKTRAVLEKLVNDIFTTMGSDPTFTDPCRRCNSDVFEYLASSPVPLYGPIPLMHAHFTESTVAVFHVDRHLSLFREIHRDALGVPVFSTLSFCLVLRQRMSSS